MRNRRRPGEGPPPPPRRWHPRTATAPPRSPARAERALAPLTNHWRPSWKGTAAELRDLALRLHEVGSDLRGFLVSLEADPDRVEQVEEELERIADAKRRFRAGTYEELLARAQAAETELGGAGRRARPGRRPRRRRSPPPRRQSTSSPRRLRAARAAAAEPFAAAVAAELRGVGMGEGEFRVELREREPRRRPAPTRPSS